MRGKGINANNETSAKGSLKMIVTGNGLRSITGSMVNIAPTVYYDLEKIQSLKEIYEQNIQFILSNLPEINWNSPKQIKEYFQNMFDLKLENVTIAHLEKHLEQAQMYSEVELEDQLYGLLAYLKQKYTIKNYLNYILDNKGIIKLSMVGGVLMMQNKQQVSLSPEIVECQTGVTYDR